MVIYKDRICEIVYKYYSNQQLNSSPDLLKEYFDVNYILFEILPILKKGVLIHFHDIFYPFEYPKEWAFKGFNWTVLILQPNASAFAPVRELWLAIVVFLCLTI